MVDISPVGGTAAPQPPQKAPAPPWDNKVFVGYLEVIMLLQSILDGVYIPGLKDASLTNQAAQTILTFLSQDKKSYMGNIDKLLTDFLNGWQYLQKLVKEDPTKLPPSVVKILNNPTFKQLASTLTEMAKIEKEDPDYKNNPKWKKLEQSVISNGGLLDQLHNFGTLDPAVTKNMQMFAELTSVTQQTFYQMATAELKKWNSIVQMASTFLKRMISVSQYVTGATLR
jgi:hypothetical protein